MNDVEPPQQVEDDDKRPHHPRAENDSKQNCVSKNKKGRIHFQSSHHNQLLFLIAPVLQSLLIFYIGNNKRGQWTMTRDVLGQAIR